MRGRHYGSTGVPAGESFRISAGPADFTPEAAGGPPGRFLVVWMKRITVLFQNNVIFGRRIGWAIDGDVIPFGEAGDVPLMGDLDGP